MTCHIKSNQSSLKQKEVAQLYLVKLQEMKKKPLHSELNRLLEGLISVLSMENGNSKSVTEALKKAKRLTGNYATWEKFQPNNCERFFTHYKQVEFLFNTRLIYSIITQRNCSREEKLQVQHQLHFDQRGVALASQLGPNKTISVEELMDPTHFRYDVEKCCLVDVKRNKSLNYFSHGLEAIDRWESDDFTPVAQITPQEQKQLLTHAKQFWSNPASSMYEVSRIAKSDLDQDNCVVQVFMCPRGVLKDANASLTPLHAAIRIIDEEGKVYSTGFGSTIQEDKLLPGMNNYLSTINGMPTLMDYEESRTDEGRVTVSLSISSKQKKELLAKLKSYRTEGIRFNILLQNCTRLAVQVLHLSGVEINNRTNALNMTISQLLPKTILRTVRKVTKVWDKVPKPIHMVLTVPMLPFVLCYRVLAYLLLVNLGGTKGSLFKGDEIKRIVPHGKVQDDLQQFTAALTSVQDLQRDPLEISHSTPLLRWILAQPTARFAEYKDAPDMRLHADQHNQAKLDRLRTIYKVYQDQLAQASLGHVDQAVMSCLYASKRIACPVAA